MSDRLACSAFDAGMAADHAGEPEHGATEQDVPGAVGSSHQFAGAGGVGGEQRLAS